MEPKETLDTINIRRYRRQVDDLLESMKELEDNCIYLINCFEKAAHSVNFVTKQAMTDKTVELKKFLEANTLNQQRMKLVQDALKFFDKMPDDDVRKRFESIGKNIELLWQVTNANLEVSRQFRTYHDEHLLGTY